MDHASNQVPRSASQRPTVLYYLGCCVTSESRSHWWIHLEAIRPFQVSGSRVHFIRVTDGPIGINGFITCVVSIILTGPQKLHMWPDCEADGSEFTKTPSDTGVKDEMDRFEKVLRSF